MTLLVALKGRDGLVAAADSRGTFGDPRGVTAQNDSQQKAHMLAPRVATLQAGSGEVGALIIERVRQKVTAQSLDGVTAVMETLRQTARESYQEWFPSVPPVPAPQLVMTGQAPARPDLAYIVAGYELPVEGELAVPRIYQMASQTDFSPMLHDYGFAVAGIAQYALYLLNRLYQPDRTVEQLTALAVYVITETASQDGKVGGPVKVVVVRPDATGSTLDEKAVGDVIASNDARSTTLRNSFYTRSRSK